MAVELGQRTPVGRIPKADGLIPGASGDSRAVGADFHGGNLVGVPSHYREESSCWDVPEPNDGAWVIFGRKEAITCSVEMRSHDYLFMIAEHGNLLAGVHIPHTDIPAAGSGNAATVRADFDPVQRRVAPTCNE